jgi:hypothetical protein
MVKKKVVAQSHKISIDSIVIFFPFTPAAATLAQNKLIGVNARWIFIFKISTCILRV